MAGPVPQRRSLSKILMKA
uniref:Uncharacterized protein n=1 Tax=Pyricularia oryzae (strain 70-15 / ATCC MYA-4617 / FGSC 8958) TaxID=242507 RepID=Q2KFX1_PYRO7|nr:hypothetical protein MGCH7_ch7g564 [Pyricularia oryzae 70-15]